MLISLNGGNKIGDNIMRDETYLTYCFVNALNPKYRFIERRTDESVWLYLDRTDEGGVRINTSFLNPVIFKYMPYNKLCSLTQVLNGYRIGTNDRDHYVSKNYYYTYPYNLIKDIFCMNDEEAFQVLWFDMTDDRWEGLNQALSTLSDRERNIVKEYFENEDMTLEKIGLQFNIHKERVRQILSKALRKLRHPRCACYIINGYEATIINDQLAEVVRQKKVAEMVEKIALERMQLSAIEQSIDPLGSPIDLLGLSTRSYNCLSRAGIKSVHELSKMTEYDLMNIRNLGKKSCMEIMDKMDRFLRGELTC